MTNLHEFGRMGENLIVPPRPTIHTAVNYLLTAPTRAFFEGAVIVIEKDIPDVSLYQGEIDYIVMSSKTDTLIIRTGQNLWRDPQFENNYTRSKEKGMLRGIYDFYDDRIDTGRQADRIVSQLGSDIPEMEVYIDWERSYGGSHGGLRNVVALMQEIERRLPQITCGLYTGYYFFRANSNPIANASQYAYLKTRPLWLAWYTNNPADVLIPAPWTHLTFWQYGTPVEDYGQKSLEIDKNYFNGTIREFYERYGTVEPVPPAPGEPMDTFRVIWAEGCNRRLMPNVNNVPVPPAIEFGATFEVFEYFTPTGKTPDQERWGKLVSGLWVAIVYNSQVRATIVVTPTPPPSGDYLLHHRADGTVKKYVPE